MTTSAECPVETDERRVSPRADGPFPRYSGTYMDSERMVRVQQIRERVENRGYGVDPEKLAGAILERLVARPGGRPTGDWPRS
jgi:hypothetical protein